MIGRGSNEKKWHPVPGKWGSLRASRPIGEEGLQYAKGMGSRGQRAARSKWSACLARSLGWLNRRPCTSHSMPERLLAEPYSPAWLPLGRALQSRVAASWQGLTVPGGCLLAGPYSPGWLPLGRALQSRVAASWQGLTAPGGCLLAGPYSPGWLL